MASQSYANHVHRPLLTAVAFVLAMTAAVGLAMNWRALGWRALLGPAALTAAVLVLSSISRVYTTRLQDRIIRLEMRVRCAPLLAPAQLRTLMQLELRRIAALRFASDGELPDLLDRTVRESLTPDQIKRAVKTWVPDNDRT